MRKRDKKMVQKSDITESKDSQQFQTPHPGMSTDIALAKEEGFTGPKENWFDGKALYSNAL